jgi:hypothetical protein
MKPEVDEELLKRIRRVIIEAGAPMIPMSLLFEGLGFTGIAGVGWGILVGVILAIAIEMGYEIDKFGKQIVIKKPDTNTSNKEKSEEISTLVTELGFGKKSGTNTQKECSDKKEEK